MRLLTKLSKQTGRRYPPWALQRSPQELGVDSLTFVEVVAELEEDGYRLEGNMAELYRSKLCRWKKMLKAMERGGVAEVEEEMSRYFFADDGDLQVEMRIDAHNGFQAKAVFKRHGLVWRTEDNAKSKMFCRIYQSCVSDTDVRLYLTGEAYRVPIMIKRQVRRYDFSIFVADDAWRFSLQGDGRVLRISNDERTSYLLPSPYMIDGAGKTCNDVRYALISQDGVLLRIFVNADWINDKERQLPISIVL